jgi:CheY-like chemotaxis protein
MTKVLLIEDEDLVARMYEKALKFDGFDVLVALGGEDGIKKVKEFAPDILFLDIMMPEPDGMEVLEKIKADPETKDIPVVMLTNLSGKHDAELAKEKGALDYIVKSNIEIADLGKMIEGYLDDKSKGNGS